MGPEDIAKLFMGSEADKKLAMTIAVLMATHVTRIELVLAMAAHMLLSYEDYIYMRSGIRKDILPEVKTIRDILAKHSGHEEAPAGAHLLTLNPN